MTGAITPHPGIPHEHEYTATRRPKSLGSSGESGPRTACGLNPRQDGATAANGSTPLTRVATAGTAGGGTR